MFRRRIVALLLALTPVALDAQSYTPGAPSIGSVVGSFTPGGFAFPIPTGLIALGDSRTQNAGGVLISSGPSQNSFFSTGGNVAGWYQTVLNNKVLFPTGYNYGVGATTSLNMLDRDNTNSVATTGNPAGNTALNTPNPGPIGTGLTFDLKYNSYSDGKYSPRNNPANVAIILLGVNDPSQAAYYTTALKTMQAQSALLDDLLAAGKTVILNNELPVGSQANGQEFHTMTSVGSGTFTATNTTGFVDGRIWHEAAVQDNAGSPLTYTSGTPTSGQYSVTTGGVYTFNTGAGTVPTGAYVTYASGTATTSNYERILHDWQCSTAATFIDYATTNYGVPGALYGHPNTVCARTYEALLDPASPTNGINAYASPGLFIPDGLYLHPNALGGFKAAKATAVAFNTLFPAATSIANTPTRNNTLAGRGDGSTKIFTGTLPPTMQFAATVPTQLRLGSAVIGTIASGCSTTSCTITSNGTAPFTAGTLNPATGAWSITFTTAPTVGTLLYFEQDFTNLVVNGMMDLTTLVSNTLITSQTTGLSLITSAAICTPCTAGGAGTFAGVPSTAIPPGWTFSDLSTAMDNALRAGSLNVTVSSPAAASCANGKVCVRVRISGVTPSGTATFYFQQKPDIARITAGDQLRVGGWRSINVGANGSLYGLSYADVEGNVSTSTGVSRTTTTGAQTITSVGAKAMSGNPTSQWGDAMIYENGGSPFSDEIVAPPLDTAGFGAITQTITLNNLVIGIETTKPISATIEYGLIHERARTD